MGGMGLLRKQSRSKGPSSEAQQLLGRWAEDPRMQGDSSAWAQLEMIENILQDTRQNCGRQEWLEAFRQLEGLGLFLEQEEEWTGVPDGTRAQLLALIMAAWCTVCRALEQHEELEAIANWKYVLHRAIETGEQLAGMCESASCAAAVEVLQSLLDGTSEDAAEEEGGGGRGRASSLQGSECKSPGQLLDFEAQCAAYVSQPGRAAPGVLGGRMYDPTNPAVQAHLGGRNTEQPRATDSPQTGLPFTTGADNQTTEDQDTLDQLVGSRAGQDEDFEGDDTGPAGSRGPDGRLTALEDVAMRPVLLRVAGRLPAGHPMRTEVEAEVGAEAGTAAWDAAVADAVAAAAAAGHVLPAAPQQQVPLPLLSAFTSASTQRGEEDDEGACASPLSQVMGGGSGEDREGGGSLFSPSGGRTTLDSRFGLFGPSVGDDLLGDDDGVLGGMTSGCAVLDTGVRPRGSGPAAGSGWNTGPGRIGASFSSVVSEGSVAQMMVLGGGLPSVGGLNTAMTALTAGTDDMGTLGDEGILEFSSLEEVGGGQGVDALGQLTGRGDSLLPSPTGLWGSGGGMAAMCGGLRSSSPASSQGLGAMQGGCGDDLGGGGGDLDTNWLLMDSEDPGAEGGAWDGGMAGGGVLGKRAGSLALPRQPSKLSRMT